MLPASPEAVSACLAAALRSCPQARDLMAKITAAYLADALEADGFLLLKKAPRQACDARAHPHPNGRHRAGSSGAGQR